MYRISTVFLLSFFLFQQNAIAQAAIGDILAAEMNTGIENYEVCIYLNDTFNFDQFEQEMSQNKIAGKSKAPYLVEALQLHAKNSQAEVLSLLDNHKKDGHVLQSYWIENMIYAKVNSKMLTKLMNRDEIAFIAANNAIKMQQWPKLKDRNQDINTKMNSEPGLNAIGAPFMWNKGYSGYGTKIFIIDSGVDPQHEALHRQHAWNNYDLDEVWIDINDEDSTYDCDEHGSHVIGIACGLNREELDTIGVAFNAEWMAGNGIGCSNSFFPRNSILDMFQWSMNPDRNSSTTHDIPDVINNSWGDLSGGCSVTYRNMFQSLASADIAVVFSAGNNGPNARTITPPANLELSPVNPFVVGAVNANNAITEFSSRGPSRCNVNGRNPIKPDVCAPGNNVRSSTPGDNYQNFPGTSMAAPHVSGAFCLLREAFPNVETFDLLMALYETAVDLGTTGEDNDYGNGLINLERAYNRLVNDGNSPVDPTVNRDAELWNVISSDVSCGNHLMATALVHNGGTVAINQLEIEWVDEQTGNKETTNWTGNIMPGESIHIDLKPMQLDNGERLLIFNIISTNGSLDERKLNNQIKRYVNMRSGEDYSLLDPNFGDICVGSDIVLSVSGTRATTINWYLDDDLEDIVHEGVTYTTSSDGLSRIYVQPEYKDQYVGMELNPEEINYGFSGGSMNFKVGTELVLRSVDLIARENGAFGFTIVRNERDTVFNTSSYPASTRQRTVPLSVPLTRGDYEITFSNNHSLAYSTQNVNFPMGIENVLQFTDSSPKVQNQNAFYYLFNWKIDYKHPCGFKSVVLNPMRNGALPEVDFRVVDTEINLDNEEELITINESENALEYLWTFGDGVSSNEENPIHKYTRPGRYGLVLQGTSADNCLDAKGIEVIVFGADPTSNEEYVLDENLILIYPNPSRDYLTIELNNVNEQSIEGIYILNSVGQKMNFISTDFYNGKHLNIASLHSGIYSLIIEKDNIKYVSRFTKL